MTPESLYEHRKRFKKRQTEFARTIGIAPRTLKAYETGASRIPNYIPLAIAALLFGLPPAP